MPLRIYYGDKMEDFVETVKKCSPDERATKGPFEFLNVAVANPNLGN